MGLHRIIALDLGKFKTVACVMIAADRSHVFETIETSPAAAHNLLVRHATEAPADTLIVSDGRAIAAAGCTTCAPRWACPPASWRPTPKPGSGDASSERPIATTR